MSIFLFIAMINSSVTRSTTAQHFYSTAKCKRLHDCREGFHDKWTQDVPIQTDGGAGHAKE
ncbi:hypothetical protein AB9M62_41710 [Bacillales bacterium AN1005]